MKVLATICAFYKVKTVVVAVGWHRSGCWVYAMLTSTRIPRPRVLQQRRIVAEAPCPERPRNRGYRCSQTGLEISEKREKSGKCLFGIENVARVLLFQASARRVQI